MQSPSAGNGNRHAARHIAEKSRTLPILAPVWSVSQLDGQGVGIVSGRQSGASRCLSIDIDGFCCSIVGAGKDRSAVGDFAAVAGIGIYVVRNVFGTVCHGMQMARPGIGVIGSADDRQCRRGRGGALQRNRG